MGGDSSFVGCKERKVMSAHVLTIATQPWAKEATGRSHEGLLHWCAEQVLRM